jgi:hypothetical protein
MKKADDIRAKEAASSGKGKQEDEAAIDLLTKVA